MRLTAAKPAQSGALRLIRADTWQAVRHFELRFKLAADGAPCGKSAGKHACGGEAVHLFYGRPIGARGLTGAESDGLRLDFGTANPRTFTAHLDGVRLPLDVDMGRRRDERVRVSE